MICRWPMLTLAGGRIITAKPPLLASVSPCTKPIFQAQPYFIIFCMGYVAWEPGGLKHISWKKANPECLSICGGYCVRRSDFFLLLQELSALVKACLADFTVLVMTPLISILHIWLKAKAAVFHGLILASVLEERHFARSTLVVVKAKCRTCLVPKRILGDALGKVKSS